jgi:hypothetical protein
MKHQQAQHNVGLHDVGIILTAPDIRCPQVKEDKASLNEMERRLKEVEADRAQLAAAAAEAAAAGLHLEKEKREKAEQVGGGACVQLLWEALQQ